MRARDAGHELRSPSAREHEVSRLRARLEEGPPSSAIEPESDEDRAILLATGARPDLASEADDLVLRWYADDRPELWPALVLPWVRDAEVLELAAAQWLDRASGAPEAGFLLGSWVNRAGPAAMTVLQKIFPTRKPRVREVAARWLADEAPEHAGALLAGLAIGGPSRVRAAALAFARRWPDRMLAHVPAPEGAKVDKRIADLREHLAGRPRMEADLGARFGEGAAAMLPFLHEVPDWAMFARAPACKDRSGAPLPAAIALSLLGSLAVDPAGEAATQLAAIIAPEDLAALLDTSVKKAQRERDAPPYLALGALAHLPEAAAVDLLASWMLDMPWSSEEPIAGMDRAPRAIVARAVLACGARPGGADPARAAVRHLARAAGKRPLQIWATLVPAEVESRFLSASVREVILEAASAPELPSLIGSVFADKPAWRTFALEVLRERLAANSARRKARSDAKGDAVAEARAFLRERPRGEPLLDVEVDARVLREHGWQQRFTEADYKYSYELTRRRGATAFEISHFPALAHIDAKGPPLVVRIRGFHTRIDPRSEDHLLCVHELMMARPEQSS